MPTAILTADGHLAIPETIRRRLDLHAGDRVQLEVSPQSTLIVRPRASTEKPSRLFGMLRHLAKDRPVSIEEMKQAVAEGAAERFNSSARR